MPALDRNKPIECDKCGKRIVKKNISRHNKSCMRGSLFCPKCPKFTAKTKEELDYHTAKKHRKEGLSKKFTCTECMLTFHSFYALRKHKQTLHGSQSQSNVTLSGKVDLDKIMGDHPNQQLREELRNVEHFLVDSETIRGKQHVFNFALTELSAAVMAEKLRVVFANLDNSAKINVSLGFVLRNIESDHYRYYYAHENSLIFNTSQLLNNEKDLDNIIAKLSLEDFAEIATRERPNTKWKFAFATNLTVFAAILKEIPLGCQNVEIPSRVLKNKKIVCPTTSSSCNPYNDNLCLLRAVTFHLTGRHNLEEQTANLFQRHLEHCEVDVNDFEGVTSETINAIEDLTELNISIYEIEVENDQLVGLLSRRSINKHSRSVTLLSYYNHICYTKDFNAVFNCFRCESCNKFFRKHSNLRRHLPVCSGKIKEKFPKSYQLKETVFEKLSNFEITVPEEYRLFKNLAIFDFESICVTENNLESNNSTTWVGKHEPISVSISSNLLKTPIFLCDPEPIKVVTQSVDALENLANESRDQMQPQFADVTSAVCEKLE